MAVSYCIKADVVDITADVPQAADVFLVDTNVWYWMTYPNATSNIPRQLTEYPGYLKNAMGQNARIYHSVLTLAELAHAIEKTEHEIYCQYVSTVKAKEYRHNIPSERGRVVSEIQAAWSQVTSLAEPMTISIDGPTAAAALNRLQTHKLDGYDLFILESMINHGVAQVITDDGDFASVPGIQLFTANRNVVQTARAQGRLKAR